MKPITLTLDLADALGVGHSLRALAKAGKPNRETAIVLSRVGQLMVDAANASRMEKL